MGKRRPRLKSIIYILAFLATIALFFAAIDGTLKSYASDDDNGETDGLMYTVTVNSSYAMNTGAGCYAPGTTVSINAGGRDGYFFRGWTTNISGMGLKSDAQTTFAMPARDVALTANWERGLVVTYSPGAHGTFETATTNGLKLNDPTPRAPNVSGQDGWRFTGWSPPPGPRVEGDATYTAGWEQIVFTVKFEDWDGALLKSGHVPYGESAVPPETPTRKNYFFKKWDSTFDRITENTTVTALYAPIEEQPGAAAPPVQGDEIELTAPAPPIDSMPDLPAADIQGQQPGADQAGLQTTQAPPPLPPGNTVSLSMKDIALIIAGFALAIFAGWLRFRRHR